MTKVCGAAYLRAGWQYCLGFSDHPAAARHPSIEGNLVWCFIFYFRVSICSHFHIFSLSSRGLTTGSRLWELSRSDTYHIYWIATVALLPRDDKKRIATTLSCHCERSEAIQSINLSQRDTYFLFNSVFAGANKFDYLDPGVKPQDDRCVVGTPRTRMTEKTEWHGNDRETRVAW